MKALSLEIQDILSIQHAKLEFQDTGLILVEGWNHDDGRANGAGKTAIFNAMAFALFDKLPRKITASEILRRTAKNGFAKVTISVLGDQLSVTRSRPKGVIYERNGVIQDWTQEEWESHIRLSYSQFILSMYTAQGAQGRFLTLNDAGKKEFLLQLLNLVEFSECKKSADTKAAAFQVEVTADEAKVATAKSRIEAYNESKIDQAMAQMALQGVSGDIVDNERLVRRYASVLQPDLSKYQKLDEDLKKKQSSIIEAKTKRSMLHDQYKRLSLKVKSFDGETSCGQCGTELDITDAKCSHETEQTRIKDELLGIKNKIDALDLSLKDEAKVTELSKKLYIKKNKESEEYQNAQKLLQEVNQEIALSKAEKQNLLLKLQNNSELTNKIKVLTTQCEDLAKKIASNKREIEFYKAVSAMYSSTGAQAYVLDSVVESFNEVVSEYIDLVFPNITYKLNSYKETAKGDITAKFSEQLVKNGQEVSAGSLSGGELRSVSIAADFAILDVLESQFGLALNPIIMDEPFNDLDPMGREQVIDLLEQLSTRKQIFVIDHASEAKSKFSKTILVEKKNDISTVKIDT